MTQYATDPRTVKALLLNGAVKPSNQANPADNWTHGEGAPLDTRYGAGVLNVFNSYWQLSGGRNSFTVSTTSTTPPGAANNVGVLSGWDFQTAIISTATSDRVNHYYFDLSSPENASYTLTSTLVWNSHVPHDWAPVNDLDLFLYAADGTLIASSTSTKDNVEHLFVQALPPGRYDLEVRKHASDHISNSEAYALAFDFAPAQVAGAVSKKVHGTAGTFDILSHWKAMLALSAERLRPVSIRSSSRSPGRFIR